MGDSSGSQVGPLFSCAPRERPAGTRTLGEGVEGSGPVREAQQPASDFSVAWGDVPRHSARAALRGVLGSSLAGLFSRHPELPSSCWENPAHPNVTEGDAGHLSVPPLLQSMCSDTSSVRVCGLVMGPCVNGRGGDLAGPAGPQLRSLSEASFGYISRKPLFLVTAW